MTTQGPKEGEIWGSKDGSSWSHVHTFTDGNSGWVSAGSSTTDYGNYPDHRDVGEGNVAFYSRYAFIITKLAGGDIAASIRDLQYFGVPEYDPDAHGTDVTVKSYPNVPNTDWLEVYYDAKNYTNGAVQDETSNNRDATLDGVVHDPVSKSFTFDGGNDKIHMGPFSNFTPTFSYTVSLWFKVPEISSGEDILFHFGHGTGGESFGMNVDNGKLGVFIWDGTSVKTQADIFTATKWVHTTCIANSDGTVEIYFNGRLVLSGDTGQALTIPTNPYLSLGIHFSGEQTSFQSAGFFKGSIANFRLFNRALTSDEIWQLYAYQKEYFGHGDLSMTLKAGRLGIGTSEPRAALDVRGGIYAPGTTVQMVHNHVYDYHTVNSNNGLITPMTTSITPRFNNSNILVQMMVNGEGQHDATFRILRYINGSSTGVHMPPDTVQTPAHTDGIAPVTLDSDNNSTLGSVHIMFVDTPNTVGVVEYKLYYKRRDSSSVDRFSLNQVHADATSNYTGGEHSSSSVVLQEIAH
jgi:hypothetical protein